ncbi:MAG: deoxyguanosinetriphosphate triphosphohydrolase [Clostridia bacterium]|nr:deoxyguanosinetriphosphate triphosphohydrolase [Clostridia bacterium]
MIIREQRMEIEKKTLASWATLSANSLGRDREEELCPVRTCFARDRDRILHSNEFRRLKHKTQVFIAPKGDHFRERMTHTLEVMQIARSIARGLFLNEDLTEAIALGHDLGHTPFGHAGEAALNKLYPGGFEHNVQSLRVVERLARDGKGLNLTKEVRDGILNHRTAHHPFTPEGEIVRLSDKIAYVNHDIQDAIRAGRLREADLPAVCTKMLGNTSSHRISALVYDVITNSGEDGIRMSNEMNAVFSELRQYMFDNLYLSDENREEAMKGERLLTVLYEHYLEHPGSMPLLFEQIAEEEGRARAVCDYLAGMSDQYAIHDFESIHIPQSRLGFTGV